MRQTLSSVACLVVILVGIRGAEAAKLVVLAVDSGNGTVSNAQPPVSPAGARGFLIGIDNSADPLSQLAIKDLTFSGPGLVQRLAPNSFAAGDLESPNVQTRGEAGVANPLDPVAGSMFARNDSWWWNAPQDGLTLSPVATGIRGGLPGGPMTMTGTYNPAGNVPAGQWRLAYIVATGDIDVTGILASGQNGFGPYGDTYGTGVHLNFSSGQWYPSPYVAYWINAAGGDFDADSNWVEGNRDIGGPAVFEFVSGTYTVTLNSDRTNNNILAVHQGNVTLDLGGHDYQLSSSSELFPSVQVFGKSGPSPTLRVIDGNLVSVNTSATDGAIKIGSGATWTNSGFFAVGAGGLVVEDGGELIVGGNLGSGSSITINKGSIAANTASFSGNTSKLHVGVGGTAPGDFGALTVTNKVTLRGTLDVDLLNGFMPALGDTFEVIKFGARVGDFATYQDLYLGGHLALQHTFTTTSLVLKAMPAVSGDINLDGVVNIFDINAVSSNWNTAGPQGDANGDGIVNIYDINAISANWGATDPAGAPAVPEPASLVLVCCGAGAMLVVARRRRIFSGRSRLPSGT